MTEEQARAAVEFAPAEPPGLGNALKIEVSDLDGTDPDSRVLAYIYEDQKYGRFWLLENISQIDETDLSQMPDACDPSRGCEGSMTLVNIPGDERGVLISGPETTGLINMGRR